MVNFLVTVLAFSQLVMMLMMTMMPSTTAVAGASLSSSRTNSKTGANAAITTAISHRRIIARGSNTRRRIRHRRMAFVAAEPSSRSTAARGSNNGKQQQDQSQSQKPRPLRVTNDEQHQEQQRRRQPQQQHLVLIGGGHAHLQVIKALNDRVRPAHLNVTLIDRQESASYSGMVPGCISGAYGPEETALHLEPLARWAGIEFVCGRVVDIDLDRKLVHLQHPQQRRENVEDEGASSISNDVENQTFVIPFDAVSIDIGSTSRDLDTVPGARLYTIPTRPIYRLIERLDRAKEELTTTTRTRGDDDSTRHVPVPPQLVVVGGGVAGIELAMTVTSRWQKDVHPDTTCTILNAGTELIPQESGAARNKLQRVLDSKHICVRHSSYVKEVTEHCVELRDGNSVPFTRCIWATGAAAHPLAKHLRDVRELDVDQRGWIRVEPTLQSTSHPYVFASGDCASIVGLDKGSPPKAGVFAVRAGPVLIENLTRYLSGKPLLRYEPQNDFLKLLACGDDKALGFRFGLALYGEWVWRLKDHIDQNFMNLFREEHLPPKPRRREQQAKPAESDGDEKENYTYDTSQYDAMEELDKLPPLAPEDAADLLQRDDDDVDYLDAWRTLRAMARDPSYRDSVVARVVKDDDGVDDDKLHAHTNMTTSASVS